jgi:1-deoxy-D-xylulose-5-phosphate reductoisomerase
LGSTGSIGGAALDIVRTHPERFAVVALGAGRRAEMLADQVAEFNPAVAVLAEGWPAGYPERFPGVECVSGTAAAEAVARRGDIDVVLAGTVGLAGLRPVLAAVRAGKVLALANKESLVMAGDLVAEAAAVSGAVIVPVDSEHSAIFQALQGARFEEVRSLVLTASGGPFLDTPSSEFARVTPEQALRHPRWNMGAKISIDSATLVNKALEVIEAHWLFGVPVEQIEVVVHPQSIVHSAVDFVDGSMVAQLSQPDMRGPIAYALEYPDDRLPAVVPRLSLAAVGRLDFRPLDTTKFPAVELAKAAVRAGGALAAVFTVANEVAVGAFLERRLRFDRIVPTIEGALAQFTGTSYRTLDDLEAVVTAVTRWVGEHIEQSNRFRAP